jgi:hypothetical protein
VSDTATLVQPIKQEINNGKVNPVETKAFILKMTISFPHILM